MCGIASYLGNTYSQEELIPFIERIQYRGPDNSQYKQISKELIFGFHRLAIMGLTADGDQPMVHPDDSGLSLICNGEIYNYIQLAQKYDIKLKTGSDCEIILHLYKKIGIQKLVSELDGVFMFVLNDSDSDILYAARDPYGVRPGFIGWKNENVMIASEAKTMVGICDKIIPLPPGTWWSSSDNTKFNRYHSYDYPAMKTNDVEEITSEIRRLLIDAVKKRLMAEREIGCLLSGGLDSSLISALVSKYSVQSQLHTFSIGLSGSVDLEYASKVADYLGTNHHNIECTEKEFLDAIETVIYTIESYDTTTVRASIGNYLVSKFIRENSDCKVIFNGDGSDEVCCGYVYLKNAPSPESLQSESNKLVREIYLYDALRSDRSISANGLEARTPFLDKQFVKYYSSIPASMKSFDGIHRLEKHLLRSAFSDMNLLPDDVLWRRKVAFSDGVSKKDKSWHHIIKNYVDKKITDQEFNTKAPKIAHCTPLMKESYYYRKIYEQFFGKHDNLIPHYWLPNWTDVIDPSARELQGYQE